MTNLITGPVSGIASIHDCVIDGDVISLADDTLLIENGEVNGVLVGNPMVHSVMIDEPLGVPQSSDRSAFDSLNYPLLHTNDTDTETGIHHTLGTGADQSASGNHTHPPLTPQPHIIDADGTIEDLTTKFNTLLSYLETLGMLSSS